MPTKKLPDIEHGAEPILTDDEKPDDDSVAEQDMHLWAFTAIQKLRERVRSLEKGEKPNV